jgi:chlorobactene glucosyltransferase
MTITPTFVLELLGFGLAAVIGAVWLFRIIAIGWAMKHRAILGSTSHRGTRHATPKLSVLVAARDEEANIETCVRTLLDQDYPDFEIVAVDDRSTDQTPAILKRLEAQAGGRLRVLTITEPREGWSGKNNAMREGVAASRGEWLLFTDADCRQTSQRTLSVAMSEVQESHVDFLSIIPILDTPTVWERIIQPVCSWVLILWFLPDRVNNPAKKTAYANGAFILTSRRCYEAIGGHERVRTELNEDIKMARFAKRGGFHVRVCENENLYRTRMYRTPREAWRGWSRIFFGSLGTVRRIGISLLMVGMYGLLPWIALAASVIGWAFVGHASTVAWRETALAWFCVVLLQQIAAWRYYRVVRVGRFWSLTHVLGCSVTFAMLVSAMLKVLGATGTTWRGTTYRHDKPGVSHEMNACSERTTDAKPALSRRL